MAEHKRSEAPRGHVTLLFSDIESSTELNERLGDPRWMEVLRAHNAAIRGEVARFEGYEVKHNGDGFMLAFASPRKGVACAVAIQRAITELGEAMQPRLAIRIGVHVGEPVCEDGDFFGRHVNYAARLSRAAAPGEVLISHPLRRALDPCEELALQRHPAVTLRGISAVDPPWVVEW